MHSTEQLAAALAGRYTVDRLIGEGGMATVYLAHDLRHHRPVALKVLKPDLGAVVGVARFLSEIQVTANLQHPNLLPLFDSGEVDGLLFYVMPYVEGESLRARLDREKQLPVDDAVRLGVAVASALDYAHRHGVIHRDLKPENILLHEGQPLVADFGIALAVSNAGGNRITQTGLSLGTPQYMSPEQATGDRVIDARTDIYSLGAVTYEMLTGEPPHTGSTSQAVIARLLTERPRSVRVTRPSVPEHVDAAVERALEKLPADRWATARELSEALTGERHVTRNPTLRSAVAVAGVPARPGIGKREIAAWSMAAAAVAAAVFLAVRSNEAPEPRLPIELELAMPDSLDGNPPGVGAASTIAISRDGATLVFVGARPGQLPSLFLRNFDDRTLEPIRGAESARSPVLSPDGSEVLFTTIGSRGGNIGSIKVVSVRGGNPRTVVDSSTANGQISWGDAGQLVLAFRQRLWTVPAGGGKRTLLAEPDSVRRHVRYGFPDILPGGRAALITIWRGGPDLDSAILGVVTIPDGTVTELEVRGTFPRYSRTGHITFATSDASLHAVEYDARTHRISTPFLLADNVATGGGGASGFDVADNGTIVYISEVGRPRENRRVLVAVDRTGGERDLSTTPGNYIEPRVSPDGRLIAFTALTGTFSNPDIWKLDPATNILTRITTDSSSSNPIWSADNDRVGFLSEDTDSVALWSPGRAEARRFHAASRTIRGFAFGAAHGYAAISVRGTGNDDIWLVHMDSLDAPRPFLTEPYTETAAAMSPDSRLLAYVSNRTGRREVYVRRIDGGAEVPVSSSGGEEPVWARDGSELFYRTPEYMMSARISATPGLTVGARSSLFREDGRYLRSNLPAYDVFPGGKEFVMVRSGGSDDDRKSAIIVLFNWHAAQSREANLGATGSR